MLHFIQEHHYSSELEQFEPDPKKADEVSRSIEHLCSVLVTSTGPGFLRHQYAGRGLIVWYLVNGSTISLLSIKLDCASH